MTHATPERHRRWQCVTSMAAPAMARARRSIWMVLAGRVPSGFHAMNILMATRASAIPASPPSNDTSRLSARNWRINRERPEPSAARTAASRMRPMPRPSVSAPTFIAAIRSRETTAAETVRSVERIVRELSAWSEVRVTTNWLKFIW